MLDQSSTLYLFIEIAEAFAFCAVLCHLFRIGLIALQKLTTVAMFNLVLIIIGLYKANWFCMVKQEDRILNEMKACLNSVVDLLLISPFPNKPCFLRVCSTSLLKTLREKEKLLVTSNFSFSHSVFYLFGKLSTIFILLKIVVCKLFQY